MVHTWNILGLKKRLTDQYGYEYSKKAIRALESINENQKFCGFHYEEIDRLLDEDLSTIEKQKEKSSIDHILARKNRNPDEFFITAIPAHTSALLRCLHSNSDLLAHFIYFCTQVEKSDVNINLKNVNERLSSLNFGETKPLQRLLRQYENDIGGKDHKRRTTSDYWYLDALVNHTKHWSNVLPILTYKLKKEGKDIYQWDFEAFIYKESTYPKQDVLLFIEREYNRQSQLLPQIIKEVDLLNEKLASKVS